MLGAILFLCMFMNLPTFVTSDDTVLDGVNRDNVTRTYLYPIASAAYGTTPELCLRHLFPDIAMMGKYEWDCFGYINQRCFFYMAFSDAKRVVIMAFRGTTADIFNITKEFRCRRFEGRTPFIFDGIDMNDLGTVNSCFYNAFNGALNRAFARLSSLQERFNGYNFWITGHSVGGSYAALMATYISFMGFMRKEDIYLVTFGQPRTGTLQFIKKVDEYVPHAYRIIHKRDPVPALSTKHRRNYHHNREIWYPTDMNPGTPYKICGDESNNQCRQSIYTSDEDNVRWFVDHHIYYEKNVTFAVNGCQNVDVKRD